MRHTLLLLAILTMALMTGCKDKGQNMVPKDTAEGDSVVTDSMVAEEKTDTTPPPMFLFVNDSKYMQLLYWSDIEEPKKTEDMEQEVLTQWLWIKPECVIASLLIFGMLWM